MKRIYLACPYSHKYYRVRHERFMIANRIAAHLMTQGNLVFSPISHSVPIAKVIPETDTDHDFWLKQDEAFLDWCTHMYIICIDGTYDSYGINWETIRVGDKPITFIYENYREYNNG